MRPEVTSRLPIAVLAAAIDGGGGGGEPVFPFYVEPAGCEEPAPRGSGTVGTPMPNARKEIAKNGTQHVTLTIHGDGGGGSRQAPIAIKVSSAVVCR